MPYDNRYERRVEMLEYMPWYNVRELAAEIKEMRKINFSIVEKRQQSLQRLGSLFADAPFSKTVRFPAEGSFVCEGTGDWSRKMQQLKSALSYKPLDKDDKAKESKGSIDDPSQAFWNATTDIMTQLVRRDGVFNRRDFELMSAWVGPTVEWTVPPRDDEAGGEGDEHDDGEGSQAGGAGVGP